MHRRHIHPRTAWILLPLLIQRLLFITLCHQLCVHCHVCLLSGLESLTRKRNLALTLHAAYGEDAWQFVPRSYSLPSQLMMWRQRLAAEAKHLTATAAAAAADVVAAGNTQASDDTSSSSSSRLQSGQQGELNTGSRGAAESASDTAAAAAAAAAAGDVGQVTGWWALKTGQHLGQGLEVVPSSRALSSMLARNAPYLKETAAQQERQQQQQQQSKLAGPEAQQQQRQAVSGRVPQQPGMAAAGAEGLEETAEASSSTISSSSSVTRTSAPSDTSNPPRPFISVQQYITQPLLINRRKFGLRIWVLVIGPKPYRAYVYRQGLVLFSSQQYNPDLSVVQAQGAASQVSCCCVGGVVGGGWWKM